MKLSITVEEISYSHEVKSDSKFTNSKMGSTHWFNTLLSEHARIGEFISTHTPEESAQYIQKWGERLKQTSLEMIEWNRKTKSLE